MRPEVDPLELGWQRMQASSGTWWLRSLGEHAGRAVLALVMETSEGGWDVTVVHIGPPRGAHHIVLSAREGARCSTVVAAKRIAVLAFRQLERRGAA